MADFQIVTRRVTFTGNQEMACTSIPISNDNRDESQEDFEVDLDTPSNVNEGNPSTATVSMMMVRECFIYSSNKCIFHSCVYMHA